MNTVSIVRLLQEEAIPLKTGGPSDLDPLLEKIGNARFVLLGEASHGTHEFYKIRAEISKRLIREKGFQAVAVEADWPDSYRVNRYVQGRGEDFDAIDSLAGFKRFPTWMWRNADMLDFIGWLRNHNDNTSIESKKVGFYGLDLYSLYASTEAVIEYLERVDPSAARQARERYSCFDRFGEDPQSYAYATQFHLASSCEEEVVAQLLDLHGHALEYAKQDGLIAEDEFFCAVQNARLVKNAEIYYRSLFSGRVSSWNLRDQHMMQTLEALAIYLEKRRKPSKVLVWAHNSHVGNAKATQMGEAGEWNIGELAKKSYGKEVFSIGFTTHHGTVTAASHWGGVAERKQVKPSLAGSYESLFHQAGLPKFFLGLKGSSKLRAALKTPRLERAIGVIYLPETERASHYFEARLPDQFDALFHFEETRAVEPLERTVEWEKGDLPETFPTGM